MNMMATKQQMEEKPTNDDEDDEWAMFGSDDEEEEDDDDNDIAVDDRIKSCEYGPEVADDCEERRFKKMMTELNLVDDLALHLTRECLRSNSNISLTQRFVGIASCKGMEMIWNRLRQRGFQVTINPDTATDSFSSHAPFLCDIAILTFLESKEENNNEKMLRKALVPGGILLIIIPLKIGQNNGNNVIDKEVEEKKLLENWKKENDMNSSKSLSSHVWDTEHAQIVMMTRNKNKNRTSTTEATDKDWDGFYVLSIRKRPCCVNTLSCPWKPSRKKVRNITTVKRSSSGEDIDRDEKEETWLEYEHRILSNATVPLSVFEIKSQTQSSSSKLSKETIQKAVRALQTNGFVVLKSSLNKDMSKKWGRAILQDFQSASDIIKNRYQVDLFHPSSGCNSCQSNFKQMAMREDLRVDLRDGPNIQLIRQEENGIMYPICQIQDEIIDAESNVKPIVTDTSGTDEGHLRFNTNILEIVHKVLHPPEEKNDKTEQNTNNNHHLPLYKGNFGRWNFQGRGPDGSVPPIRIGPVGGILSLPGAADQAIHADTPHLFENYNCLPAHYVNVFTPGKDLKTQLDADGNSTGETTLGGTAILHGTHELSVTAKLFSNDEDTNNNQHPNEVKGYNSSTNYNFNGMNNNPKEELHMRIIRPSLELGDVLLFDCRVLHFGLANTTPPSINQEESLDNIRPMLYVNMTHSWFHDPKNWDKHESIF